MDYNMIKRTYIQEKLKKTYCLFSGKPIERYTKSAAVMTNKAYGNCTFKLLSTESLACWLYLVGGKKYLRPSIVKKFELDEISEKI